MLFDSAESSSERGGLRKRMFPWKRIFKYKEVILIGKTEDSSDTVVRSVNVSDCLEGKCEVDLEGLNKRESYILESTDVSSGDIHPIAAGTNVEIVAPPEVQPDTNEEEEQTPLNSDDDSLQSLATNATVATGELRSLESSTESTKDEEIVDKSDSEHEDIDADDDTKKIITIEPMDDRVHKTERVGSDISINSCFGLQLLALIERLFLYIRRRSTARLSSEMLSDCKPPSICSDSPKIARQNRCVFQVERRTKPNTSTAVVLEGRTGTNDGYSDVAYKKLGSSSIYCASDGSQDDNLSEDFETLRSENARMRCAISFQDRKMKLLRRQATHNSAVMFFPIMKFINKESQ
ncbi:uncharacterized protein BXIN_3003 [Babesia sp. Xinjiang]|uniref:uncharacterized protein n=1 Tax=Babesia sp. Xinjiang TaxID=462227 RepID=UPI000A258ADA|nr:uncharacterized protein BXIN_3003 [Babesia sp. Xinjiang]ORM39393.1 hypothetical protein BXIN_3003 [Babesia sp. Xinjiang]